MLRKIAGILSFFSLTHCAFCPFGDNKQMQASIKGRAFVAQGFLEIPIQEQELQLLLGDSTVAKIKTDSQGKFEFRRELKLGEYRIQLGQKTGATFKFEGRDIEDLKIVILKAPVQ